MKKETRRKTAARRHAIRLVERLIALQVTVLAPVRHEDSLDRAAGITMCMAISKLMHNAICSGYARDANTPCTTAGQVRRSLMELRTAFMELQTASAASVCDTTREIVGEVEEGAERLLVSLGGQGDTKRPGQMLVLPATQSIANGGAEILRPDFGQDNRPACGRRDRFDDFGAKD